MSKFIACTLCMRFMNYNVDNIALLVLRAKYAKFYQDQSGTVHWCYNVPSLMHITNNNVDTGVLFCRSNVQYFPKVEIKL